MIEIRATRQPAYWGDDIEIRIIDRESRTACKHIKLEAVGDGEFLPAPIQLSPEMAQGLMNSLWDCGLRPSAGQGSVGQLSATERHLEDMRTIAFGCLKDKVT